MLDYLERSRRAMLQSFESRQSSLAELLPEVVFRCGGSVVRPGETEFCLSRVAKQSFPELWKKARRGDRLKRLASMARSFKSALPDGADLVLIHIGDGGHQYTLLPELKGELNGSGIEVKFFVVDPAMFDLPDGQKPYTGVMDTWNGLLDSFSQFVEEKRQDVYFLVTLSLDRTVIFPISRDNQSFDLFIHEALERYVSAFSVSDVRAMTVANSVVKVQKDFRPYRDVGEFHQDYDLLALAVLSLASGVIHGTEISGYREFRKSFLPDMRTRIVKGRWGLGGMIEQGGRRPGYFSQQDHWRKEELAIMMEDAWYKIGIKESFNDPFRLAQNSVLLEKIQDGTNLLNRALFDQLALLQKRCPRLLVVGFTDMPLAAMGLYRSEADRVEPMLERNSAFFAKIPPM